MLYNPSLSGVQKLLFDFADAFVKFTQQVFVSSSFSVFLIVLVAISILAMVFINDDDTSYAFMTADELSAEYRKERLSKIRKSTSLRKHY